MTLYIVIRPDVPGAIDPLSVAAQFPNRCYEIVPGRVWAIATPLLTCHDVCQALGIGDDGPTCVVVRMSDYYGFANRALWESLRVWSQSQDG